MSTVFTWTVTAMNCYTQEGGHNDVVFTVHWTCSGVFADTYGSVYSTCSVPAPEGSFTPYADLTQDQVLGWIYANGVDKDATQAAVEAQIQEQIAPTVQTPPLPWAV
jgi:hypothetical protein